MTIQMAERFFVAAEAGGATSAKMALVAFRATTGGCSRGWADSEISFDLVSKLAMACQCAIDSIAAELGAAAMPLSWASFSAHDQALLIFTSVGDTRVMLSPDGELSILLSDGNAADNEYYRWRAVSQFTEGVEVA
jgi:hypothetical protein